MTPWIPRRHAVWLLLTLLSSLYWAAVWAWTTSARLHLEAQGVHALPAAVNQAEQVWLATVAWVAGALVVHLVGAAVAWRRADREAGVGLAVSLGLHAVFVLTQGIVRPFG